MRKIFFRIFFPLLTLGIFLLKSTFLSAEDRIPHFLILSDAAQMEKAVQSLTSSGARIRLAIPAGILIVDSPRFLSPGAIPGVKNITTHPIAIDSLESIGPLAVAAGLQWNRDLVRQARPKGASTFGMMSAEVSHESLPAPTLKRLTTDAFSGLVEWNTLPGATGYEMQLSVSQDFKSILTQTKTDKTQIQFPIDSADGKSIFFRIRGIDRGDATDASKDLLGRWTTRSILTREETPQLSGEAPILMSPVDSYHSAGFTLILEWSSGLTAPSRVQVAKDLAFSQLLVDEVTNENEFIVPSSILHVRDELFWRVRQWGPQQSPWSGVRSIQVEMPEGVPNDMLINPEQPR